MDTNENKGIWIPFEIWECADLSPMQRILLSKIYNLSQKDGVCWAGDEFLADQLVCTPQYIRKMRKDLCETNYLACEGYGHRRKMTVLVEATIGTSNDWNKQLQLQKKQQSLQKLQPQLQVEATTVAQSIELSKEKSKEQVKKEEAIVLPWNSERFADIWKEWKEDRRERKIKKYTRRGELAALHKLHNETNGDEQQAIEAIQLAIANQWQGIYPRPKKAGTSAPNRDQLETYLKYGTL
jgi:hypothetical protein